MSRTKKHPPKPDRFTRKHRTGAHQARAKRVVATIRELHLERELPEWLWEQMQRRALHQNPELTGSKSPVE